MQQPFPLLTDATQPSFPQQVVLGSPAGTNVAMAILWQQGSSALFSYVPLILWGVGALGAPLIVHYHSIRGGE